MKTARLFTISLIESNAKALLITQDTYRIMPDFGGKTTDAV